MQPATASLLTTLEPIAALSPGRVEELAAMCVVETVSQGLNPFRMNVVQSEQLLYLLKGELKLAYTDGRSDTLQGGNDATRHPVVSDKASLKETVAMTDIQILRIDADLLDIMLTWDQLAKYKKSVPESDKRELNAGKWMDSTCVFSAESLKNGIFKALPPANVEEMFRRMERLQVGAGREIVRQGDEGDYYYLIEQGVAEVTRAAEMGAMPAVVAVLESGQAFGEEALVSGNKRNANVVMRSDGALLRLGKSDFVELLKKPLLVQIGLEEAKCRIRDGAQLLDVRTPSEFELKHFPQAVNVPLHDIRNAMKQLDPNRQYITFCQTGRRASAAAFLLAQGRFQVSVFSAR